MKHVHRMVTGASRETCWTHCVTPDACAAKPARQRAHGGIVRRDVCRCGAVRLTEINGYSFNTGAWTMPDALVIPGAL